MFVEEGNKSSYSLRRLSSCANFLSWICIWSNVDVNLWEHFAQFLSAFITFSIHLQFVFLPERLPLSHPKSTQMAWDQLTLVDFHISPNMASEDGLCNLYVVLATNLSVATGQSQCRDAITVYTVQLQMEFYHRSQFLFGSLHRRNVILPVFPCDACLVCVESTNCLCSS